MLLITFNSWWGDGIGGGVSSKLGCGWGDRGWISSYGVVFFLFSFSVLVPLYFVSGSHSLYLGG